MLRVVFLHERKIRFLIFIAYGAVSMACAAVQLPVGWVGEGEKDELGNEGEINRVGKYPDH